MTPFTLVLPFPPTVNSYWRHVILGKPPKQRVATLLYKAGRKYKDAVCIAVFRQQAPRGISCPVAVRITLHAPDRKRRDVDNYCKAPLDGLVQAGVLVDDSQMKDLRVSWGENISGGKAVVTISALSDAVSFVQDFLLPDMPNREASCA